MTKFLVCGYLGNRSVIGKKEEESLSQNEMQEKQLREMKKNKPIQDGGEAKAPLWLNWLSGTNWL